MNKPNWKRRGLAKPLQGIAKKEQQEKNWNLAVFNNKLSTLPNHLQRMVQEEPKLINLI